MDGFHHFRVKGKRFLFDVRRCELHEVSRRVYTLIEQPERARLSRYRDVWRDLQAILRSRRPLPDETRVQRTLEETPPPITFLWLGVTHDCNLRCRYCFLDIHGGEEKAYMSTATAREAVDFLVRQSQRETALGIVFFGGEPLLNLPVIRETVAYARSTSGKTFSFSLTTNGVRLTPEVSDELHALGVSVLLSLDGDQKEHDRLRVTPDGQPSWRTIVGNVSRIPQRGRRVAARATATAANCDYDRIYRQLRRLGFERIAISEASPPPDGRRFLHERQLATMKRQYAIYAEHLFRDSLRGRVNTLSPLHTYANRLLSGQRKHYGCSTGKNGFYVAPDRRLYACSRMLTPDGRFSIGSLDTGIDPDSRQRLVENHVLRNDCRTCWARFVCGGNCFAENHWQNGDAGTPPPFKCEMTKYQIELAAYYLARYQEAAGARGPR